jgi:hypothetical protein
MNSLGSEKGRGGCRENRPITLVDVYDIAADIGKVSGMFPDFSFSATLTMRLSKTRSNEVFQYLHWLSFVSTSFYVHTVGTWLVDEQMQVRHLGACDGLSSLLCPWLACVAP